MEKSLKNVVIAKKSQPFSWLPNSLVNDPSISMEILAIALYLNGKPENWRTRPFDICARFKIGKRVWLRISRELKELGFLIEKKTQDGTELWFSLDSYIATKLSIPLQDDTLSTCENGTLTNLHRAEMCTLNNKDITTIKNKDINYAKIKNTNLETKQTDLPQDSKLSQQELQTIFDTFWHHYPLKKAKQTAFKAFSKQMKGKAAGEAKKLAEAIWEGLKACVAEHETKTSLASQGADVWVPNLPHLATWINNGRWEDGYESPEQILSKVTPRKGLLNVETLFN
jgi:hypothetical protein